MKVKLDDGAFMPERAHFTDAGLDLFSPADYTIYGYGGKSVVIDTGVHVQLPHGTVGMLKSKSGLNVKHGLVSEVRHSPIDWWKNWTPRTWATAYLEAREGDDMKEPTAEELLTLENEKLRWQIGELERTATGLRFRIKELEAIIESGKDTLSGRMAGRPADKKE